MKTMKSKKKHRGANINSRILLIITVSLNLHPRKSTNRIFNLFKKPVRLGKDLFKDKHIVIDRIFYFMENKALFCNNAIKK
jgi:hypothetical protein